MRDDRDGDVDAQLRGFGVRAGDDVVRLGQRHAHPAAKSRMRQSYNS